MEIRRVTNQAQLEAAFRIRIEVFVEEQGVPQEDELDQYEEEAEHILVYEGEEPVGTARLRQVEGVAKLERICLLPAYRASGYGRQIIAELERIASEKGWTKAKLHAQEQAKGFYAKLGYEPASDVFMEDGIPHLIMVKTL
ncbi:GNAT family N-acetyltransferase [Paenibacillus daejeonensis]|uniref:GNAT family N-acetyltransferase n=1 Tax=Paenibacillus daejeonensis TaxID=135193 RepID=UPI000374C11C|nr:GNAT family N-acetyltransferase [Paenibacillus daejeonensis]